MQFKTEIRNQKYTHVQRGGDREGDRDKEEWTQSMTQRDRQADRPHSVSNQKCLDLSPYTLNIFQGLGDEEIPPEKALKISDSIKGDDVTVKPRNCQQALLFAVGSFCIFRRELMQKPSPVI